MLLALKTDLSLSPERLDRGTKRSCSLSGNQRFVEVGRDLLRPRSARAGCPRVQLIVF